MDGAVDTSRGRELVTRLAAFLWHVADGVDFSYGVLDDARTRLGAQDAYLVAQPEGMGPQLFVHRSAVVSAERVRTLLHQPLGLHTEPATDDPALATALGGICNVALSAEVFRREGAAMGPRPLGRAAARAARYGWRFTLVLLATEGARTAQGLLAAVRAALRSGDEAAAAGPGIVLALLGEAGGDVVRPFVARVRAALDAGGDGQAELLAATARAPEESVDPAELLRLASERLGPAAAPTTVKPTTVDPSTVEPPTVEPPTVDPEAGAQVSPDTSGLELDLRLTPGVVCVSLSATRAVVYVSRETDELREALAERVRQAAGERALEVVVVGEAAARNGRVPQAVSTNGVAPLLTAAGKGGDRVVLLDATFDAARGLSEVRVALGATRGTGRAPAGPVAGGAQATLNALGALGLRLPYYLVSAERAHTIAGAPVVVVLAHRHDGTEQAEQATPSTPSTPSTQSERIGMAGGASDVEAASRATLGALNRYLQRLVEPA